MAYLEFPGRQTFAYCDSKRIHRKPDSHKKQFKYTHQFKPASQSLAIQLNHNNIYCIILQYPYNIVSAAKVIAGTTCNYPAADFLMLPPSCWTIPTVAAVLKHAAVTVVREHADRRRTVLSAATAWSG